MAKRVSEELGKIIEGLEDGKYSSTRERTRNRCLVFLDYCRENHRWQEGTVPDRSWLLPYAKTMWAKLESEKTVIEKMDLIVALCQRLAEGDKSAAQWAKVTGKSIVDKLPARYGNRR